MKESTTPGYGRSTAVIERLRRVLRHQFRGLAFAGVIGIAGLLALVSPDYLGFPNNVALERCDGGCNPARVIAYAVGALLLDLSLFTAGLVLIHAWKDRASRFLGWVLFWLSIAAFFYLVAVPLSPVAFVGGLLKVLALFATLFAAWNILSAAADYALPEEQEAAEGPAAKLPGNEEAAKGAPGEAERPESPPPEPTTSSAAVEILKKAIAVIIALLPLAGAATQHSSIQEALDAFSKVIDASTH